MADRYSGNLKISVVYDDRGFYRTAVSREGRVLWRGRVRPPAAGFGRGVAYDSPEAYDRTAHAALSFAADDKGGVIEDAADYDRSGSGWDVRRVPRYWQQYPGGSSRRPRFSRRDSRRRRSA